MVTTTGLDARTPRLSLAEKLWSLNWGLLLLLTTIASFGFAMLYSAANGDLQPWASRQMVRFGVSVTLMIAIALVDIRFWLRSAYIIFGIAFVLLVAVEVRGAIGMGAQRWIDLGIIQLQPSELMKVALILALARYFHGLTIEEVRRPLRLVVPALFILTPAVLVLKQPDLGTALMLLMCGAAMFFLAGVRLWKFALVIAAAGGALPLVWGHMREYQRNRIYTFLDPENDPLGSGYHILQSRSRSARAGSSARASCTARRVISTFCPRSRPTSSSPCWPRNLAWSAGSSCSASIRWSSSTASPSRCAAAAISAVCSASASPSISSSTSSSTRRW